MSIRAVFPSFLALLAMFMLPAAPIVAAEAILEEGGIVFDLPDTWTAKTERTRIPSGQLMQRWVRAAMKTDGGTASPGVIAIATPVPDGANLALLTQNVLSGKPYGIRLGADTTCLKCVKYTIDMPNGSVVAEAPDFPAACHEPTQKGGIRDCQSVNAVGLRLEPSWIHTYNKDTPTGRMKVLHLHLLNGGAFVDMSFWYPTELAGVVEAEIFPILASMRLADPGKDGQRGGNLTDTLQYRRKLLPALLDELPRQLPQGLALKSIQQNGDQITVTGNAQSSARVAQFMRSLAASSFFASPDLGEVKAVTVAERQLNEFTLKVLPRAQKDAPVSKANIADPCAGVPPVLANIADIEPLLIEINATALTHGMFFELFKPGPETASGTYARIPLTVGMAGSYNSLRKFVRALNHLPALVVVDNFSIGKHNDGVAFNAVLNIYRALRDPRPLKAAAGPKAVRCPDQDIGDLDDPFSLSHLNPEPLSGIAPDPLRRKGSLEAYPLESLRFVGTFLMHGKPTALIRTDKALHQVRVGDYLGTHSGLVTSITENEVVLRELVPDGADGQIERKSTLAIQKGE